ncbi:MAG: DNA repair protein RecN [Nitrospinales bacterium]
MLKELRIANFAIIDRLAVEFQPSLNVLTGETGAGKSILIDALTLALGGRADSDLIRGGQTSASVEALFHVEDAETLERVRGLGIEVEDGQLIVRRTLSLDGKNRALLNGCNVTVGVLGKIGDRLVDIHGQHDHQTLLHPECHLDLLDAYGKLVEERRALAQEFAGYRQSREELEALLSNERDRLQREDLLNFQIHEIDQADLSEEEEERLKSEKNKLANAETIHQSLQRALALLAESEGAVAERMGQVDKELKQLAELDPDLERHATQAQTIYYEVEDLVENLRACERDAEFPPGRLEEVDDRLAEIHELKRKYGNGIPTILEYREKISSELLALSSNQERVEALKAGLEQRKRKLVRMAVALAEKREKAAQGFQKDVEKELRELNMKKARIGVRFNYEADADGFVPFRGKTVKLNSLGLGGMEFVFSPNPGEEPRPLAKIASGGELSRVMLALKTILNEQDNIPVLVFDEVDSGVGGQVAEKVGARLKKIAARKQVLCLTHLPQIAGMAETHFVIRKDVSGKRTRTQIQKLDFEGRVEEIARMSGGETITEATRRHALEMIKPA